jgi:lipopolysaccharide export LptBFGC system permease protein LptF
VEWHKKPALAALCLVFVLAGAAIGSSGWGTLGRGFTAFLLGWTAHALFAIGEQAADAGRLPPALAIWGPIVVMGAVGLAMTGLARRAIEGTPASGSAKS